MPGGDRSQGSRQQIQTEVRATLSPAGPVLVPSCPTSRSQFEAQVPGALCPLLPPAPCVQLPPCPPAWPRKVAEAFPRQVRCRALPRPWWSPCTGAITLWGVRVTGGPHWTPSSASRPHTQPCWRQRLPDPGLLWTKAGSPGSGCGQQARVALGTAGVCLRGWPVDTAHGDLGAGCSGSPDSLGSRITGSHICHH